MAIIVKVLDDIVMFLLVVLENDGFDGWVAFDQDSWVVIRLVCLFVLYYFIDH